MKKRGWKEQTIKAFLFVKGHHVRLCSGCVVGDNLSLMCAHLTDIEDKQKKVNDERVFLKIFIQINLSVFF